MLIQRQTHVAIWLGLELIKYKKSSKAQTVWETQVVHVALHSESIMVKRTRMGALRILILLHEKSMRDVNLTIRQCFCSEKTVNILSHFAFPYKNCWAHDAADSINLQPVERFQQYRGRIRRATVFARYRQFFKFFASIIVVEWIQLPLLKATEN